MQGGDDFYIIPVIIKFCLLGLVLGHHNWASEHKFQKELFTELIVLNFYLDNKKKWTVSVLNCITPCRLGISVSFPLLGLVAVIYVCCEEVCYLQWEKLFPT